jgi:hypothetical protein
MSEHYKETLQQLKEYPLATVELMHLHLDWIEDIQNSPRYHKK